ncbi:urease accessory protein UreF [Aminobacter carboxidus]|uniref:Urease accessory protein UreF n=1 Tax=Aminobacter carboxidus TaxID=376165 RepID=A0A8E2BET2_9HYPH|nr:MULTISPECIES: urease accessory UreF family protein [Aminobacter carboxidus group]MBB6468052.1 urease accessory protein [Aminobacter lissarensis]MBE1205156.1 urease accessory protein UreF [Aminobacter carboxidus]
MNHPSVQLLVAFQHADGQFPSGGFAFSQGLEASSSLAGKLGVFEFAGFVDTQIRHRWANADRVALVRAHRLAGDLDALAELDREVEASTFVEGLRSGSRRNGTALLTTHGRLGTKGAAAYRAMVRNGQACGHLAVVQGLVWQAVGLDETTAVAIGGYQMVASLATAAVRLGLIGAIDAQASIARALPEIEAAACRPLADDEALRSFTPLCEIAVAMHGTSGQRLFSN